MFVRQAVSSQRAPPPSTLSILTARWGCCVGSAAMELSSVMSTCTTFQMCEWWCNHAPVYYFCSTFETGAAAQATRQCSTGSGLWSVRQTGHPPKGHQMMHYSCSIARSPVKSVSNAWPLQSTLLCACACALSGHSPHAPVAALQCGAAQSCSFESWAGVGHPCSRGSGTTSPPRAMARAAEFV